MKLKSIFKRLPRKVMVGRKAYKVSYPDLQDEKCVGQMSHIQNFIHVCKTQEHDEKESTLIHEIIHAIDLSKNIGLSETQVLKIEAGLIQVLRRNGWKIVF